MNKNLLKLAVLAVVLLCTHTAVAQVSGPPLTRQDSLQHIMEHVKKRGKQNGLEAYEEMSLRYNVPAKQKDGLRNLLITREVQKVLNTLNPQMSLRQKVMAKMMTDSLWQDSIDLMLMPYNRGISGDNISFALRISESLKLDNHQRSAITACAIDIAHKLRSNPRIDVCNHEMQVITSTLDEKQQDMFFSLKNAPLATKDMKKAWSKIEEAEQTEQLDSMLDCAKAYFYYLERQRIRDISHNNRTLQRKLMDELANRKPLLVKMAEGLEREEQRRKNTENMTSVGKEFIW